ncbi:MAG TPA: molecular chaperone SurA, partial [Sedimenticola sp.]|nr:molecular chaperone SurA [Sedimenticola sp.]
MRYRNTIFSLPLMLLLLAGALPPPLHAAQVEPLDHIVAVVDEDVIVQSEVDRMIRSISAQIRESGEALPPHAVLQKQVLERLIMRKLQVARAKRIGINVSEEMLAQAISNIARRNGLTLSGFRKA